MTPSVKPNPKQQELIDCIDKIVKVDAGPGTGKTATIVQRYVNILKVKQVQPSDILMLTFTENAANEMSERIKDGMEEEGMDQEKKKVLAMTFDSFFHSIVMDNAEFVGDFFGIKKKMTRSARLVTNETLAGLYFQRFYEQFMDAHGKRYGDIAAMLATEWGSVYEIINRLMSKGVIPTVDGWFGYQWEEALYGKGDADGNLNGIIGKNILDAITKDREYSADLDGVPITRETIDEAFADDRSMLVELLHDVFLGYIEQSINDNQLTFALNSTFAFTLLYSNKYVRNGHKFQYVMIDEFQDTDAKQLMVALMLLKENCPHLCAVGDWKQGIYEFRYVSVENIKDFENRLRKLHDFLNHDCPDGRRSEIRIDKSQIEEIVFEENYRSTSEILNKAYDVMAAKATDSDSIEADIETKINRITAQNSHYKDAEGGLRFIQTGKKEEETDAVIRTILDYADGEHVFYDKKGNERMLGLGDVCILCRTTSQCRTMYDALKDAGIPAFLQGDVEIMSTREGKLALAWLKYVMNENDPAGIYTIMYDMGYSLARVVSEKNRRDNGEMDTIPMELKDQRMNLRRNSRRIPGMMTRLFEFYDDLDQEIVQAITSTISTAHRNSLLTIADIVSMIEEDIRKGTKYEVEGNIDRDAVRIMTMHKSKGMEFPAVIIPYFDQGSMPRLSRGGKFRNVIHYSELAGVRCIYEMAVNGDYKKKVNSWKTALVRKAERTDYDEERRLLFVALSRGMMYETLICGDKPCKIMEHLKGDYVYSPVPENSTTLGDVKQNLSPVPTVPPYEKRRTKLGVHDIMRLDTYCNGEERSDEMGGKGMAYGTEVHKDAEMIKRGRDPEEPKPEHDMIRRVLADLESRGHMYIYDTEVGCQLPVRKHDVMLKGTIDLIACYDDHIEIHDWKTDYKMDQKFMDEYKLQLSVYAHAAKGYFKKEDVRCFLQYVSLGETVSFEPMSMERIEERVGETLAARGEFPLDMEDRILGPGDVRPDRAHIRPHGPRWGNFT